MFFILTVLMVSQVYNVLKLIQLYTLNVCNILYINYFLVKQLKKKKKAPRALWPHDPFQCCGEWETDSRSVLINKRRSPRNSGVDYLTDVFEIAQGRKGNQHESIMNKSC